MSVGLAAPDYFALFSLPPTFAIDRALLDQQFRKLQAAVHPDRFVSSLPSEQRQAAQQSTLVNEAYQVLKDPLRRATYLCERAGHGVNAQTNTAMPTDFLITQMQWREELEAAISNPGCHGAGETCEKLQALHSKVERIDREQAQRVAEAIDVSHAYVQAGRLIREWMFMRKLLSEIEAAQEVYC